jgi:hypothetical protein
VPTYASATYGCALAHSPQTTREVWSTFYSRLSQYGPHGPWQHARFARSRATRPVSITGDPSIPHSGVRSTGDSIYDKSLTSEPILPSRTANQYLARYWYTVRDGKIGSPVRDLSRGRSSVRYGIRLGDLKESCFILFFN